MNNNSTERSTHQRAPVPWRLIFKNPVMLLAFGFGSGLMPKAPGTAGTLVAIPFAVMLSRLSFVMECLVIAVMFAVGIWLCRYAADRLKVHDHPGIVWDEIVGYALTVLFVPDNWIWWTLGFVLFRLFDIVKPWPIREMDHRIHGGLGIMLDDVAAAVYAALCLVLIHQVVLMT